MTPANAHADPSSIVDAARPGDQVVGWKLDGESRRALLARFPPRYPTTVADHVTLKAKVAGNTPLPRAATAAIVGHADDGRGVEAFVVAIDGATDRPDGSTYHITWSLGAGRRARESNDVLARQGWTRLAEPIAVDLKPARFR